MTTETLETQTAETATPAVETTAEAPKAAKPKSKKAKVKAKVFPRGSKTETAIRLINENPEKNQTEMGQILADALDRPFAGGVAYYRWCIRKGLVTVKAPVVDPAKAPKPKAEKKAKVAKKAKKDAVVVGAEAAPKPKFDMTAAKAALERARKRAEAKKAGKAAEAAPAETETVAA